MFDISPRRATLWLTHHSVEQHDRCALVGGQLICRRCLWSYPLAVGAMLVGLAGFHWPSGWDVLLLWLLPAPAIIEFVAEHLIGLAYRPRRQAALSAIGGVAFGRGLTRYLEDNGDQLFWSVSIAYSLVMAAAALYRFRRDGNLERRRVQHESDDWWAGVEANLDAQGRVARESSRTDQGN
jgi:hypothetical protein